MKNLKILLVLGFSLTLWGCAFNSDSEEDGVMSDTDTPSDTAPTEGEGSMSDPDFAGPESQAPAEGEMPVASTEPAPAPAPADSTSIGGTGEYESYTTQKGDTLMKIAFSIYGDIDMWKQIYNLNKDQISNANGLRAGQALKYEKPASAPHISQNGDPYLIKRGDTLGTIANDVYANQKKWRKLYENNRELIKDPNKIYAGFYLYYQITEQEKMEVNKLKGTPSAANTETTPETAAETQLTKN